MPRRVFGVKSAEPFPTNAAMAVGRRITRLACGGQSLTDPFEVRRLFPILLLQHDSKSVPRRGGNKKYKRVASIRSDSSGRSDPSRFVGGWAGDGRVSCTALGAPAFPQRRVRPSRRKTLTRGKRGRSVKLILHCSIKCTDREVCREPSPGVEVAAGPGHQTDKEDGACGDSEGWPAGAGHESTCKSA